MDVYPKAKEKKINKWNLIVFKSFCTAKKKMKGQPGKWEKKIFASDMSNKGLISKICEQLIQLNIKNEKSVINKWAEEQLSLCATTIEPVLWSLGAQVLKPVRALEPVLHNENPRQ